MTLCDNRRHLLLRTTFLLSEASGSLASSYTCSTHRAFPHDRLLPPRAASACRVRRVAQIAQPRRFHRSQHTIRKVGRFQKSLLAAPICQAQRHNKSSSGSGEIFQNDPCKAIHARSVQRMGGDTVSHLETAHWPASTHLLIYIWHAIELCRENERNTRKCMKHN